MRTVIHTYSGKLINPLEAKPEDIEIVDIAHATSHLCRYTGHVKRHYSVAEHAYWVSIFCEPQYALAGLLHDAAEGYLNDIASPLKMRREYKFYRQAEDALLSVIFKRFGLVNVPANIWDTDRRMIATEVPRLFRHPWDVDAYGPGFPVEGRFGVCARVAKGMFLRRFKELYR